MVFAPAQSKFKSESKTRGINKHRGPNDLGAACCPLTFCPRAKGQGFFRITLHLTVLDFKIKLCVVGNVFAFHLLLEVVVIFFPAHA